MIDPFIIANNKTNLDVLLIALFFTQSSNDYLLNNNITDYKLIYLQELIKSFFIDSVRRCKSVIDLSRLEQVMQKVSLIVSSKPEEIYSFLVENFNGDYINLNNVNTPYINLIVDSANLVEKGINKLIENKLVNTKLLNIPRILAVNITKLKKNIKIDLQKRIKLTCYLNNSKIDKIWIFQAVICRTFDDKYYVVLCYNDQYFMYDSTNIPCMSTEKLDLNNSSTVEKIKLEGVFVIYRLMT